MKTSVIEVRDMLSVLTVDEVEKRIGKVPGVASATVNYAARNATVRYDETRLEVADIKVIVHQRGRQTADESTQARERTQARPKAGCSTNAGSGSGLRFNARSTRRACAGRSRTRRPHGPLGVGRAASTPSTRHGEHRQP